jgi:inosine/xanthosine triphosphate pyrophosphatase family protein
MTNVKKMQQLKDIAQSIINCTEKADPIMPWMIIEENEDEFAKRAINQMSELFKIAERNLPSNSLL